MESYEGHIRVPRTARYRALGDPAVVEEVWFVLHGYGQLAERFIQRFIGLPGLDSGRRAVVAPEALSRFYVDDDGGEHGPDAPVGATWMTRADREHEIRDYVEYLDRLAVAVLDPDAGSAEPGGPIGAAERVVVLGFSQGAATASRWVTYGRVQPVELVLWGGGLAADLDMAVAREVLRGVSICLVTGDRDEWAAARASESLARLASVGIEGSRVEYAGGHGLRPEPLSAHWAL